MGDTLIISDLSVLIVITDLEIGGTPLQILRLAREFKRKGVRVGVCSLSEEGPITYRLLSEGIDTYALGARSIFDLHIIWRLVGLIRRLRPDVIHSFLVHANVVSRLANLLAGFPSIHIGTICTIERIKRWHNWLERISYNLSDAVVCVSFAVRDFVEKDLGIKGSTFVVRPGIDIEDIKGATPADPALLGIGESNHRVCYLGRLDPVKGIDIAIKAIWWIYRNTDLDDIQLLIIGDGPQRNRLMGLADRLGISDRVYFLGFRQDYASILKICKVCILPSYQEGWGIAVAEAICAGLVPVVSNAGGSAELVQLANHGIIIDGFQPHSFAKGIIDAFDLQAEANKDMSEGLLQLSSSYEAEEYLKLYRSLLFR